MDKNKGFQKRKKRVRSKIKGTKKVPRFSVHRSNNQIYVQIIDDEKGITLLGLTTGQLSKNKIKDKNKTQTAFILGEEAAAKAKTKKIKRVVFDRSGFKYHGRVKAVAEGARKGGLEF
jgi:large subunit ribosomal protein L18